MTTTTEYLIERKNLLQRNYSDCEKITITEEDEQGNIAPEKLIAAIIYEIIGSEAIA